MSQLLSGDPGGYPTEITIYIHIERKGDYTLALQSICFRGITSHRRGDGFNEFEAGDCPSGHSRKD